MQQRCFGVTELHNERRTIKKTRINAYWWNVARYWSYLHQMLSSVQYKPQKGLPKALKAIKIETRFPTSIARTSTTTNQSIPPWHTKVDYLSHCLEAGAGPYPMLYLKPNSPPPNKINERHEMRLRWGCLQAGYRQTVLS